MFVASQKKRPRAFRQGGIGLTKNRDIHVAALAVGLVRVKAKVGIETEVAYRQGVADIHTTRRLEPGEYPVQTDLVDQRQGLRRQVESARQAMPVERGLGYRPPIFGHRMNDCPT